MSKLNTFSFTYRSTFKTNSTLTDVEILGSNVPSCYIKGCEERAFSDIKYAITQQKVVNFELLKPETEYAVELDCRFLQNVGEDTYDQAFTFTSLEEIGNE